jgi:hypothetical protein
MTNLCSYLLPVITLLCSLAGCTGTGSPAAESTPSSDGTITQATVTRQSAWGAVFQLAEAPQADAPALLATGSGVWLAWSQSDETGSRHVIWPQGQPPYTPQIDATHPLAYRWFPGGGQTDRNWQLLFWLDRDDNELLLNVAMIDDDSGQPLRIQTVSSIDTYDYTLARWPDAATQIVYSGAFREQTALYTKTLHPGGSLLARSTLRLDATHPALTRIDDALWLYWMETQPNSPAKSVYRGRLAQGDLPDIQQVGTLPLSEGDTLDRFSAATDDTHTYFFWQIRRADSTRSVWFSSAGHSAGALSTPAELTFRVAEGSAVAVPFNTDNVQSARPDGAAAPSLAGVPAAYRSYEVLPVALHTGNTLGMAYFDNGTLTGYQDILRTGSLLRAPSISTTILDDIYLTWSEPGAGAPATFYLTTTVNADTPETRP